MERVLVGSVGDLVSKDASGRVAAAISVSAPRARVGDEGLIRELAPQVVAAAESLSRELGYVVPA